MNHKAWGIEYPFVDVTPYFVDQPVDHQAEDLNAGNMITIVYRGTQHTVYVIHPLAGLSKAAQRRRWYRYVYRRKIYKSLSAIASFITGDPTINGNRFFRLRRRRRGK